MPPFVIGAGTPNEIDYAELWTTLLDQQAQQVATSGWMEANASNVQYVGGKKFRVPTMYTTGLGDYERGTGAAHRGKYAKGAAELKYTDYELEMDRSAEFAFDRHDVDESGFIVQAPNVMGEFQRSHVVPEIDSFRYSRIASIVKAAGAYKTQVLTDTNILEEFLKQIRAMQNITGRGAGDLVATMPFSVWSLLEIAAKKAMQFIPQTAGLPTNLNYEVGAVNGIPIIPVVEDRMKTAYIFHDGKDELGYEPDEDASTINWIITPRNLPIAISKTDNLKVFTPDVNQDGDDWLIQYRKYHDLWIMKNQVNQIVLSVQPAPEG